MFDPLNDSLSETITHDELADKVLDHITLMRTQSITNFAIFISEGERSGVDIQYLTECEHKIKVTEIKEKNYQEGYDLGYDSGYDSGQDNTSKEMGEKIAILKDSIDTLFKNID